MNANETSLRTALDKYGLFYGLNLPHRRVMFMAQIAHESMNFKYDKEIWGPTAAQKKYEGRADLGNTQPGDGYKFRGRTAIQLTGRYNYRKFTAWARKRDPDCPDFEENPDLVLTDPWEGLVPIWFWDAHSLNDLADKGDFRGVTKVINGGYNGYQDRCNKYGAYAIAELGWPTIMAYQEHARLDVDGKVGPKTIAALHMDLTKIKPPVAKKQSLWDILLNLFKR